jgi:FlaA1/EpsC-like NDP-sugar epimerase
MTISEAVSLAVQASTHSQGSEIFVLDMGEPVRIVDLAETMIRLAGMVPYDDIDIQFTGLRPGEKLIEEINGDGMLAMYQDKVQIIRERPLSWDTISNWIDELEALLGARQVPELIQHMQRLVPEYKPASKASREPSEEMLLSRASNRSCSPFLSRVRTAGRIGGKSEKPRPAVAPRQFVPPIAYEH